MVRSNPYIASVAKNRKRILREQNPASFMWEAMKSLERKQGRFHRYSGKYLTPGFGRELSALKRDVEELKKMNKGKKVKEIYPGKVTKGEFYKTPIPYYETMDEMADHILKEIDSLLTHVDWDWFTQKKK